MIIVKLMGGLGNQMFQYAYGRSLSCARKDKLFFDLSFFDINFRKTGITPREYELGALNIVTPSSHGFFPRIIGNRFFPKSVLANLIKLKVIDDSANPEDVINVDSRIIYLNGYFQSENYFEPIKESLRHEYRFLNQPLLETDIYHSIKNNSNSVGVLVRRDDYITRDIDQSLDIQYFKKAIAALEATVKDPFFYVFTIGDEEWSKQLCSCTDRIRIVKNAELPRYGFFKMFLLSSCSHNIIPNSSYGWWSAWLNSNPGKVVVFPKAWGLVGPKCAGVTVHRCPDHWLGV